MCELLFTADPAQKAILGDKVCSADDLTGDFFGADCAAQSIFDDANAAGGGAP